MSKYDELKQQLLPKYYEEIKSSFNLKLIIEDITEKGKPCRYIPPIQLIFIYYTSKHFIIHQNIYLFHLVLFLLYITYILYLNSHTFYFISIAIKYTFKDFLFHFTNSSVSILQKKKTFIHTYIGWFTYSYPSISCYIQEIYLKSTHHSKNKKIIIINKIISSIVLFNK